MNETYRSQFRFPWVLYEALQVCATTNGVSLNAEIVNRLQNSLALEQSNNANLNSISLEQQRQGAQLEQILKLLDSLQSAPSSK